MRALRWHVAIATLIRTFSSEVKSFAASTLYDAWHDECVQHFTCRPCEWSWSSAPGVLWS